MHVAWNKKADGFQDCWIWQFGQGSFEIISIDQIPINSQVLGIGLDGNPVEIQFQSGRWITIAVPNASHHYRVECGIDRVMFHEKWFNFLYED